MNRIREMVSEMSSKNIPFNELDQSIKALGRSQSALPRFMRALSEGELWFLTPYHPEIEGEAMEVEEGMRSPFVELEDGKGIFVPVFSSAERLDEAILAAKVPPNTYSAAGMESVLVLELLSKMNLRTVLNRNCATGEVELPQNLMSDVADGSAFDAPPMDGPSQQKTLTLIEPADYPTDLLQPIFEFVRQHENFRALWVFHHGEDHRAPGGGLHYQFVVHMDPRDASIYHDFQLVVASTCKDPNEAGSGCVDETDENYLAALWDLVKPFYVAKDQRPPRRV